MLAAAAAAPLAAQQAGTATAFVMLSVTVTAEPDTSIRLPVTSLDAEFIRAARAGDDSPRTIRVAWH